MIYPAIRCDECGIGSAAGDPVGRRRARKAREIAKSFGWSVDLPGGRDMCGVCARAFEDDLRAHVFDLIESLGFVPWSCDSCGQPGVKSLGPEGYCHKHRPKMEKE